MFQTTEAVTFKRNRNNSVFLGIQKIMNIPGQQNETNHRPAITNDVLEIERNSKPTESFASAENQANSTTGKTEGNFNWSSEQQGLFLGAYFYGYVCTNILGGWLGNKFGFTRVFGLPIFISALLSVATPSAAYKSFSLVILCRVLTGLVQGISASAFQCCWSSWAPPLELSILNSIAYSGSPFGEGIVYLLAGYISATVGWEAVFYVLGGLAIGWSVIWIITVSDSPRTNRYITATETAYIESSIGFTVKSIDAQKVPWRSIMTSRSVFAIFAAHFADNWGLYTYHAILPTFMSQMYHFNVFQSGAVVAGPYLAQVGVGVVAGFVTDFARQRKWISTLVARKVNTMMLSVLHIFMITGIYFATSSTMTIVLFGIGVATRGFGCK
ncbi:sialin-like [Ciona intestinalis]